MNTKTPCRYCKDRNATCHSACVKYKEWRDEYDAEQEKIKNKIRFDSWYEQDYHNARNKRRIKKEKMTV